MMVMMMMMVVVVAVTADADPHTRPADNHSAVMVVMVVVPPVPMMMVVMMRNVDLRDLHGALFARRLLLRGPSCCEVCRAQRCHRIRDRIEQFGEGLGGPDFAR